MLEDNVTIWKDSNGNECFRFPERKPFERPWLIAIVAILLFAISGVEFLVFGSFNSLTPVFILFFFAVLWWLTIPMKANEAVIEKTVHTIMDAKTKEDAEKAGIEVAKSFVHYDTKGTYAIITGRCFLVRLQDESVWEYPITYHKPSDEQDGYYECEKEYKVSENPAHIDAIKPRRKSGFIRRIKVPDNVRFGLLIFAIVITGGLAFWGCYWIAVKLRWWALLLFFGYLALFAITGWVSEKWGGFMKVVEAILSIPLAVLSILVEMIKPFITIVGSFFIVAIFAFGVPVLALTGISALGFWTPKPETFLFIVLALGSILCSLSNKLNKWIIHHSPFRDWGDHKYEAYKEELAVYVTHTSNVIFVLYFLYFTFLVVSGYLQIEKSGYLVSESYDAAILKAFLVFIAFTNMRIRAKETEIEAKELLKKTIGLFVRDNDEE